MHPALRKGPLFTKKHPPFSTFYNPPISFLAYGNERLSKKVKLLVVCVA